MSYNINSFPIGTLFYQSGNGVPTHIAVRGCPYIDVDTGNMYINKNGIVNWVEFLDNTFNNLSGLTDVTITGTPSDGQALVYDNGAWRNENVDLKRTVKIITGTTYTLEEEDKNKILHFTSNTDVTITIPLGLGSTNRYEGKQLGTGQLLFGIDVGGDLRVGPSELAKTAEQYSVFGLDVIGTEEYILFGKLELS